jgi:molecular chaperone HtpG
MNERAAERIPFAVEINRMIEVLAAQIYPSPFALLRENIQNSFDAILLRKHFGQDFTPRIDVDIEPNQIRVADNGIGMSRDDLRNHFWRAGSSSKNTPDARAAGVVGTFGIGAMANFGIAEELDVVTESAISGERTSCRAQRSTLSVTEECIEFSPQPSTGAPGTEVTAKMQPGKSIDVNQAVVYITEFIQFLRIAIYVNKKQVSGVAFETAVPLLRQNWAVAGQNQELGGGLKADFNLTGAIGGEVRIELSNVYLDGQYLSGSAVFRQDGGGLRTFRSLFGLATTSLSSSYQFGGVADFLFLQPTAGREALTTSSVLYLQKIVSALDTFVSERLALRQESNNNQHFVMWVSRHRRFDLCSNLQIRMEPNQTATLGEIRERSQTVKALVYTGNDSAIIQHASEERPLLVLSQSSARRDCEIQFLRTYCNIDEITDAPSVLKPLDRRDWSLAESALSFRIATVLSNDYFLESEIKFGSISHQLPVLSYSQDLSGGNFY